MESAAQPTFAQKLANKLTDKSTYKEAMKEVKEFAKSLPAKTHSVRACGVEIATNSDWVKEDFTKYGKGILSFGRSLKGAAVGLAKGAVEGYKAGDKPASE